MVTKRAPLLLAALVCGCTIASIEDPTDRAAAAGAGDETAPSGTASGCELTPTPRTSLTFLTEGHESYPLALAYDVEVNDSKPLSKGDEYEGAIPDDLAACVRHHALQQTLRALEVVVCTQGESLGTGTIDLQLRTVQLGNGTQDHDLAPKSATASSSESRQCFFAKLTRDDAGAAPWDPLYLRHTERLAVVFKHDVTFRTVTVTDAHFLVAVDPPTSTSPPSSGEDFTGPRALVLRSQP